MHAWEEVRWRTVSLQKFINEIHLRAAIDRFLCSLPLNIPFSTIYDPAFTETNKAIEHLQKTDLFRETKSTGDLVRLSVQSVPRKKMCDFIF